VRLLQLLSEKTGKLEDVLNVERELARVRGEVEQMEGRLRVLNNLTSLTTVNVDVQEIQGYVPEDAAGYTTRLRRAWDVSLANLSSACQTLSIAAVAITPWIVIFLLPACLLVLLARRRRRRKP
jgi:hypothetical protein